MCKLMIGESLCSVKYDNGSISVSGKSFVILVAMGKKWLLKSCAEKLAGSFVKSDAKLLLGCLHAITTESDYKS